MNWILLITRQRFIQWWCRYAPIPMKRCMVCGRWFWNWLFWHALTWRWGLPEYCSRQCADDDLKAADQGSPDRFT